MKKILALALALLMVVSMVPAMALVSSAEELKVDKYGSGAETWRQSIKDTTDNTKEIAYYMHTQFLLTVPAETWKTISEAVGFTPTTYNKETNEWTEGGIKNGKFVLHITDIKGTSTDVTCPPTTTGSAGNTILRFETADYGTPEFQIEYGNTYSIKLDIYTTDDAAEPTYTGTEVTNISWAPGKASDGCDKMYKKNKALDTIPTYTPENDPYSEPVEVEWVTYNNLWFENHTSWGRVLMIGFSKDSIPDGGDSGLNTIKSAAKVRVTYEDGTVKMVDTFAPGSECFDSGTDKIFRVPYDPLPAPGEHKNVKVEFVRKSDDKVMFTGTVDFNNPEYENPTFAEDEPVKAGLAPYNAAESLSDWGVNNGQDVLLVTMSGILDEADVHSNMVDWTVLYDGEEVKNPIESIYDLGAQEDGSFSVLLRLAVGKPTEGEHTIQVTVSYEEEDMYTTDPLTVKHSEGVQGTKGDFTGDGKVTPADRNYMARALNNWAGYELPDAAVGDFTGDGKVTAADRNYMARALNNWAGYTV